MAAPSIVNSTIAAGNVAQIGAAEDRRRSSLLFQAFTADIWVNFLGVAAVDTGFKIVAGQTCSFSRDDYPMITNEMSICSATAGASYCVMTDIN